LLGEGGSIIFWRASQRYGIAPNELPLRPCRDRRGVQLGGVLGEIAGAPSSSVAMVPRQILMP
jgi:hypothetical protein